jgi:hypothetical protein
LRTFESTLDATLWMRFSSCRFCFLNLCCVPATLRKTLEWPSHPRNYNGVYIQNAGEVLDHQQAEKRPLAHSGTKLVSAFDPKTDIGGLSLAVSNFHPRSGIFIEHGDARFKLLGQGVDNSRAETRLSDVLADRHSNARVRHGQ